MRFPNSSDVVAELSHCMQGLGKDVDSIDVRLQVYPNGTWEVHSGLADYDLDHNGFWGAATVGLDSTLNDLIEVASDLIQQAREAQAEQA